MTHVINDRKRKRKVLDATLGTRTATRARASLYTISIDRLSKPHSWPHQVIISHLATLARGRGSAAQARSRKPRMKVEVMCERAERHTLDRSLGLAT